MQIAMTATISLGLFVIGHAAFAEDTTSFAKIDVVYHSSTNTLDVTGIVYKTFSQNYALTIFDPQGRLIVVSQLQLSQDDTFSQSIIPSSALWSESGNYTVKLASGPEMLSEKSFYFSGISCCVPNSHGVQASLPGTTNVIDSPLKQFKSGIKAQDVVCKESLQLVIKAEDETPACVKPQTVFKIVERGWGLVDSFTTETMNIDNTKFSANYTIANAKILNIKMDTPSKLLIVTTQTNGDGNMIIQIPQDLLKDSSSNLHYAGLIVLDDGQESNYKEIKTTHDRMILLIPFFNGTTQIEIIATYY